MGAKQSSASAATQAIESTLDERGGWHEETKDFEIKKSPNQGQASLITTKQTTKNGQVKKLSKNV